MAFFQGKYPLAMRMAWDAYNSNQDETDGEMSELALMKTILPTVSVLK